MWPGWETRCMQPGFLWENGFGHCYLADWEWDWRKWSCTLRNISTCRGVRVMKRRLLVRMIGFISSLVTHSSNYTQITALSLIYTLHNPLLHAHTSPLLVMQWKHRNKRFKSLQVLHMSKVFKSHTKSSHDEHPVAVFHRELSHCHLNTPTLKHSEILWNTLKHWTELLALFSLHSLRTDHTQKTAYTVGTCLPNDCIATVAARLHKKPVTW
jgi:hypothetical protein